MTEVAQRREYPQREICMYGRYIQCQILNWLDGPPPKYLACHPLSLDFKEEFFATQKMGAWMRVEPREILALLDLRSSNRQNWSSKEMRLDESALDAARDIFNRQRLVADGTVDDIVQTYLSKVAGKSFADSAQITRKGLTVYVDIVDHIETTADWLDSKLRVKFNLPYRGLTYIAQLGAGRIARYKVEPGIPATKEAIIDYLERLKRSNWP